MAMDRPNCISSSPLSPAGAEALGSSPTGGDEFRDTAFVGARDRARIDRILDGVRNMGPHDTLLGVLQQTDAGAAAEHATTIRTNVERAAQERVAAYAAEVTSQLLASQGLVVPGNTLQNVR
jgi:hypothetical protein